MTEPWQVLQAAHAGPPRSTPSAATRRRAVVIGAGGALGSAVTEQLLAAGRLSAVLVAVERPLLVHVPRLVAWVPPRRPPPPAAQRAPAPVPDRAAAPETPWPDPTLAPDAVIVLDAPRAASGRDDAFVRPGPDDWVAWAAELRALGCRRLVVAVPHATARLPAALRAGLSNLDEVAVAGLGFDQLWLMRLMQPGGARPRRGVGWNGRLERLADAVLSQLHWMVPAAEQPVRHTTTARLVEALLATGGEAAPGIRVLPPELLWHLAQGADADELIARWCAEGQLPARRPPRRRW
jgi:hypothetical protein